MTDTNGGFRVRSSYFSMLAAFLVIIGTLWKLIAGGVAVMDAVDRLNSSSQTQTAAIGQLAQQMEEVREQSAANVVQREDIMRRLTALETYFRAVARKAQQ